MKTFFLGTLILVLGVGGCATPPTTSEEEMLAARTRTYEGVSSEQVFQASENLLKLVDEKRFKFSRENDQLTGVRSGQLFTNLGATDITAVWLVKAQDKGKSTDVTIEAGWQSRDASAGIWGKTRRPQGTAVYTLFFNRLDTLLGKSNEWMTCNGMEQAIAQGEASGDIRMLCAYADDKLPDSLKGKS